MLALKTLLWLFITVVVVLTASVTLLLIHEAAFRLLAPVVEGRALSLFDGKDASGVYIRRVVYEYTLPGHAPRQDSSRMRWAPFKQLCMPLIMAGQRGEWMTFAESQRPAVKVRAYEIGGHAFSRSIEHDWEALLLYVPMIFAPIGWLLCLTLYFGAVVRPRRQRWLYTDGEAMDGVISGGREHRTRHGAVYVLQYQFVPRGQTETRTGTVMATGKAEFDHALNHPQVLVLYDPQRPKRSTIYEYGGYRWPTYAG